MGLVNLILSETDEELFEINHHVLHPSIDSIFMFKNGTYAYTPVGGIPKRKVPEMGSFIKDGNSDEYDFQTHIDLE